MNNRDKVNLIVLFVIVFLTVCFAIIAPLLKQQDVLLPKLAETRNLIKAESAELSKLLASERSEEQNKPLDNLKERLIKTAPKSAIVTFPVNLRDLMKEHDIFDINLRLLQAPSLPGSSEQALLQKWMLSIPKASSLPLGEAIAGIENKYPLLQIEAFTIQPDSAVGGVTADMQIQVVSLP